MREKVPEADTSRLNNGKGGEHLGFYIASSIASSWKWSTWS